MKIPRRVILTGCAGFVGSHLAESLTGKGVFVIGVDNLSNGYVENLEQVDKDLFEFHEMDVRSDEFREFIRTQEFDTFLHFAANAYVPPSVENPEYDFENNLVATFRLLETLRNLKTTSKVITVSSAAVYGDPVKLPMHEEDPIDPISPYGVSKLGIEKYTEVFSRIYGIKTLSLRLFSTYGPRQKKQIVYDFIKKLHQSPEELVILGDGTQQRDMIFVKDVVNAVLVLLDNAPFNGETYNVATGQSVTTLEIGQAVSSAMGLSPKMIFTGSIRRGDPHKWLADIGKLKSVGFNLRYSFMQGVQETVAWSIKEISQSQ